MSAESPRQDHSEFQAVIQAFKKILRARGISYRELSRMLGLSESGVKKIFAAQDGSFGRLSQIAKTLGFRITDLLDEIDRGELKSTAFTLEQQQYLLKHLDVFRFFVKLVIERQPVAEIQAEFRLPEPVTFRYLRKLDELKLIRLLPGNEVRLPAISLIRDFGGGPLLSRVYREWSTEMARDLADPAYQTSGQFIVRSLRMKDETYQEFLGRLLELEREFLRRAVREMNVASGRLRPMRWISMADQQSFVRGTL